MTADEHRASLIHYVMWMGGKTEDEAKSWLDQECPGWRTAAAPDINRLSHAITETETE